MPHRFSSLPLPTLLLVLTLLCGSGCSLPKYTTIRSEQPPNYYLGMSPNVSVVNADGATRRMQDLAIQALRNQSRDGGHFVIENRLDEGIRFDVRQGRMVMTGKQTSVSADDVFIKFRVIASMKQDGRTTITRRTGILGTEEERIPAVVTVMPVAFTVTKGEQVLLNERQYDGKAVWPIGANDSDYPADYRRRFEAAVGEAVKEFLSDVTPKNVSRRVRLDYTDEQQKPILNAARDGQIKEAHTQLRDYAREHSNSSSAIYNLAVLTDALGQYEQALTYYEEALSLGGKDYYTEAKTACMKRLNEKREMTGAASVSSPSRPAEPERSPTRADAPQASSQVAERPGDGGSDIAWVQRTLNDLGHDCGTPDGVMGPNTRACIRSFQNANSLNADGEVNEATYQKILELR